MQHYGAMVFNHQSTTLRYVYVCVYVYAVAVSTCIVGVQSYEIIAKL